MATVLLVDDDDAIRSTVRSVLKAGGLDVAGEAANGEAGVKQFKKVSPDIVLLDIDMPKMNGVDALRAMRKENDQACIIMFTSVSMMSVVDDCILNGAADYLHKDTPAPALAPKVKEIYAKHSKS